MCKTILPAYNSTKIKKKIDHDFPELTYDLKCTATFFIVHSVYAVGVRLPTLVNHFKN